MKGLQADVCLSLLRLTPLADPVLGGSMQGCGAAGSWGCWATGFWVSRAVHQTRRWIPSQAPAAWGYWRPHRPMPLIVLVPLEAVFSSVKLLGMNRWSGLVAGFLRLSVPSSSIVKDYCIVCGGWGGVMLYLKGSPWLIEEVYVCHIS